MACLQSAMVLDEPAGSAVRLGGADVKCICGLGPVGQASPSRVPNALAFPDLCGGRFEFAVLRPDLSRRLRNDGRAPDGPELWRFRDCRGQRALRFRLARSEVLCVSFSIPI